jgi:hypothetical protein
MKRSAFIASAVLIFPAFLLLSVSGSAQSDHLVAHWSFDEASGNVARDSVRGANDTIRGVFKHVNGVAGQALRFDGETTSISQPAQDAPDIKDALSVEAWVAVSTYPWNWVPIIDESRKGQHGQDDTGYWVGVDAFGHLGMEVAVNGKFQSVISKDPLPLKKWSHIAATYQSDKGLSIYIDGKLAGELASQGPFTPAHDQDLLIGHVREATLPLGYIHPEFPVWYSFDGLIDELQLFNIARSESDIAADFAKVHLPAADPLSFPKLPSGPPGPGRFGAYYTHLQFEEMWDMPRRVGADSDVVVRFDQSPIRLVFWQGTSYIPAWVTENGKWYTDEFMETGGSPGCPLGEDCEPMSDKQNRYSHVSVIQSNDARAIIHWRYGLCEVEEYVCANPDPYTGWTDWADEYYTVYPDGVAARLGKVWSSNLGKNREFQETIVINPPGTLPEDNINTDALYLANLQGQTQVISWATPPKKGDRWDNDDIQQVNLKSSWKPFQIALPPTSVRPYVGEKTYSTFEWWNHWPVQQVKSSGISATARDKTSHTSLSHFEGKIVARTDDSLTKVMLHGLSQKPVAELVPLAKSWISPPNLSLQGEGFTSSGYDVTQRAFVVARSGTASGLRATFNASNDSPLVHPALVIKNWGEEKPRLKVDGKQVSWGPDYRFGKEYTLDGVDLVVWMNIEAVKPLTVEIAGEK